MRVTVMLLIFSSLAMAQKPTQIDTATTKASDIRVVSTDTAIVLQRAIDVKGTKTILSISSQPASWRLVHDGKRVLDLFYCSGITHTINKMECFKTRKECDDRVRALGLVIDETSRVDELQKP
jgi:hypothetical protein